MDIVKLLVILELGYDLSRLALVAVAVVLLLRRRWREALLLVGVVVVVSQLDSAMRRHSLAGEWSRRTGDPQKPFLTMPPPSAETKCLREIVVEEYLWMKEGLLELVLYRGVRVDDVRAIPARSGARCTCPYEVDMTFITNFAVPYAATRLNGCTHQRTTLLP
jgi:hypothetical protein